MIDSMAVDVIFGVKVPHPDFKWACVVCRTFATNREIDTFLKAVKS